MKKIICGVLALSMIFSVSGCKQKKSAEGQIRNITWYCELNGGGNDAMWDTAEVLKLVVEKTGIRPKIITPTDGGGTKLNLMIATKDMPDLMTFASNNTTYGDLINQKMLYTIDEVCDEFTPDLKKQIPEVIMTQAKDRNTGKLYGVPGMFITGEGKLTGTQGYNVRADIYEELGSPDMTTPDGFINALKLFKEKYPTIDGRKTIPLDLNQKCWGLYILERSFGIINDNYVDEDGNVKVKWRNPKYRELIKFMARLNREGLLDNEMYVKQGNQITEDRATGATFCIASSFDQLWDASSVLKRSNEKSYYKMIEPMRVVDDPVFQPVVPYSYWCMTSIPKLAKNPEDAAKLLEFMWSAEGNTLMNYGIEGKHYIKEENGALVLTDDVKNQQATNADGFMKETGIKAFRFLYFGGYYPESVNDVSNEEPNRAADRALASKYAKIADTNLARYMNATKDDVDIQNIHANMDSIVNATIHKYTLEPDEDKALAAFDNMLKEFDKANVGKLEEFRTAQYKKNVELYGEYEGDYKGQ